MQQRDILSPSYAYNQQIVTNLWDSAQDTPTTFFWLNYAHKKDPLLESSSLWLDDTRLTSQSPNPYDTLSLNVQEDSQGFVFLSYWLKPANP